MHVLELQITVYFWLVYFVVHVDKDIYILRVFKNNPAVPCPLSKM